MPKGDCYEATVLAARAGADAGVEVCHGLVIGTGGKVEGKRFSHAWLELDDTVIDVANDSVDLVPKDIYYEVGQVQSVVRYTAEEAVAQALRAGHYGPWAPWPEHVDPDTFVMDGGIVVGFDGFAWVINDLAPGDDVKFVEAFGDNRSIGARAALAYLLMSDCCGVVSGMAGCSF